MQDKRDYRTFTNIYIYNIYKSDQVYIARSPKITEHTHTTEELLKCLYARHKHNFWFDLCTQRHLRNPHQKCQIHGSWSIRKTSTLFVPSRRRWIVRQRASLIRWSRGIATDFRSSQPMRTRRLTGCCCRAVNSSSLRSFTTRTANRMWAPTTATLPTQKRTSASSVVQPDSKLPVSSKFFHYICMISKKAENHRWLKRTAAYFANKYPSANLAVSKLAL